jgi:hypothetical protein
MWQSAIIEGGGYRFRLRGQSGGRSVARPDPLEIKMQGIETFDFSAFETGIFDLKCRKSRNRGFLPDQMRQSSLFA